MRNIKYILVICFFVLLIASCRELDYYAQPAVSDKAVQISLIAENESNMFLGQDEKTRGVDVDVDEGVAPTYDVSDFVLFIFDENGKTKGLPAYYEYTKDMDVPVVVPEASGVKYTAVIIANLHRSTYVSAFSHVGSLDELRTMYYKISSLEHTYGKDLFEKSDGYDLLMNGAAEISSTTEKLECHLYRNVAKLTLTLKNPQGSGLTVTSVQVRSVASTIDWVDHLVDGGDLYPSTAKASFIDYALEEINLSEGTDETPVNAKTLVYYMPRNMRGQTSSASVFNKNINPPSNATYVDIYAVKGDGSSACYQFFLGNNMKNDFNVVPNFNYVLSITFNNIGNPIVDSRVRIWPGTQELEYSNSYLINPSLNGLQTLYKIPVVERVNTFWNNEGGDNASGYTIGNADTWRAEVIWQDQNKQLIEFCNADGSVTADGGTVSPQYTGNTTLNFRPKAGVEGNVVIGIKRTSGGTESDGYLWSWHLWITNYSPDQGTHMNWTEGRFATNVPGGQLQHYTGTMWDAENSKYHNHWIMDRNLGAMNADSGSYGYSTKGGFFQFGRKDYMASTTIYNIKGTKIGDTTPGMAVSALCDLAYSVKKPNYCFKINNTSRTWMYDIGDKPGRYSKTNYYNPDSWYPEGETGKSFFDPCPQGWKLPENGVYAGLIKNFKTLGLAWNHGYDLYLNGSNGETVWFPAGGYTPTNSNACTTVNSGTTGKIGTATFSGNYCYQLRVESGSAYMDTGGAFHFNGPSGGVNVRCIQDK